jgi:hypothetical protein
LNAKSVILHATPAAAQVPGSDNDGQGARRADRTFQFVGELLDGFLLDLRSRHDPVGQPVILRQADDRGVLDVRYDADPGLPGDRHEMVRAAGADRDRADSKALVGLADAFELGDDGTRLVAAGEDLADEHAGDPAGGVAGVRVRLSVDHQGAQQVIGAVSYFVLQGVQFDRSDEFGQVVVRPGAAASGGHALSEEYGNRLAVENQSFPIGIELCHFITMLEFP